MERAGIEHGFNGIDGQVAGLDEVEPGAVSMLGFRASGKAISQLKSNEGGQTPCSGARRPAYLNPNVSSRKSFKGFAPCNPDFSNLIIIYGLREPISL